MSRFHLSGSILDAEWKGVLVMALLRITTPGSLRVLLSAVGYPLGDVTRAVDGRTGLQVRTLPAPLGKANLLKVGREVPSEMLPVR